MKAIKLKNFAKINLSLDVVGKRDDGYHLLKMIMQSVDLYDEMIIKAGKDGILVKTDKYYIPTDERNIAHKAVKLFYEKIGKTPSIEVHIKKNIPVSAGMAGGSSNGAGVLLGLNHLEGKPLKKDELLNLALSLGADVPFCLVGGSCLCEGIGEKITKLPNFENVKLLIVKPNFGISTKDVFKEFSLNKEGDKVETEMIIEGIKKRDTNLLANNMKNLLESVSINKYPEIGEIKKKMLEKRALASLMTGSGPTVFAIFKDDKDLKEAYKYFKDSYREVFITKTTGTTIEDTIKRIS